MPGVICGHAVDGFPFLRQLPYCRSLLEKPGGDIVKGELVIVVRFVAHDLHELVHVSSEKRPLEKAAEIEAVGRKRLSYVIQGFLRLSDMAQDRRLEHPCRGIVPVAVQGMAEFVEGVLPASFSGAYLGAGEISRILPRGVPCGFVEEVVGFAPAVPVFQAESQVVYGLAVVGVLVASGQDFHRLAQIAFGLVEARPAQIPEPQGVVVAYVGRVAPQRLLVVVQGAPGRMPVLLKVQTCQIQLLAAFDFRGLERRFGRIGHRSREIVLGLAAQSVDAEDYLVEGAAVAADHTLVHDFRRQREFFRVEFLAVPAAH